MSGRRKSPTAQLLRRGSPKAKKRLKTEPIAGEELPLKPKSLSKAARQVWNNYESILVNNRTLSKSDGIALQMLAECYSEWHQANEFIRKYGDTYIDTLGTVKQYPQVKQRSDARKDTLKLLREFGLSPSSRAGIEKLPDMTDPDNLTDNIKIT